MFVHVRLLSFFSLYKKRAESAIMEWLLYSLLLFLFVCFVCFACATGGESAKRVVLGACGVVWVVVGLVVGSMHIFQEMRQFLANKL